MFAYTHSLIFLDIKVALMVLYCSACKSLVRNALMSLQTQFSCSLSLSYVVNAAGEVNEKEQK